MDEKRETKTLATKGDFMPKLIFKMLPIPVIKIETSPSI